MYKIHLKYPNYKLINGEFDPKKSHSDIVFSKKNKVANKSSNEVLWAHA
jgi:hypothetical protein